MKFLYANTRRHIWGYADCLCPTKRMPGLNELISILWTVRQVVQFTHFSNALDQFEQHHEKIIILHNAKYSQ